MPTKRLILLCCWVLSACTTPAPTMTWAPHDSWWVAASQGQGHLNRIHDRVTITPTQAQHIHHAWVYWSKQSMFELRFYDSLDVNAFAESTGTTPQVLLTIGMIKTWANDAPAIAYVMAHELAHLHLKHYKTIPQEQEIQANLLSYASNWLVPYSGLVTGPVSLLMSRQSDRDIELEADQVAFEWLKNSPYGLCGAQRILRAMKQNHTHDSMNALLQTHPSFELRLKTLEKNYPEIANCADPKSGQK